MKIFKHKKSGEIATYKDGVLKSSNFCVEIGVEPSNEYWEEINPLLISEDGVNIFEGDRIWYVLPYTYKINTCIASKNTIPKDHNSGNYGNKNFSTKEAAIEYVLMNKPCLSIKEICPIIGKFNNTTYIDLDKLTAELIKLSKTKSVL